MSEYRERKPTSKGLLARVKCQQRNARTNAILSVFPKSRESVSLQKPCYVAGSITSQYFLDFLNLSESCREKAVFVQRHKTSLHSNFRQTALKLTPKGLDYTQIDTLREPCITESLILRYFRAKPKLIEDDANGFVKALYHILVPRAYDPSGLRQESRALGATISGMRHR